MKNNFFLLVQFYSSHFFRVIKEIKDRGRELSLLIDSNFKEQFIMINNNKITLEKLKNKNEYYSNFTSSIIDHNTCLYDIELTKFVLLHLNMSICYKTWN